MNMPKSYKKKRGKIQEVRRKEEKEKRRKGENKATGYTCQPVERHIPLYYINKYDEASAGRYRLHGR